VTSPAELRARVARTLEHVVEHRPSLDVLLDDLPAHPRARGFVRSLSYDSVRWFIRLDALLKRLLTAPSARLDSQIRALAVVGLCQLLHSETAPHAAVAETVNAARTLGKPKAAGFLNAVLRRCQREGAAILRELDRDPAIASAHPRWLADALKSDWPDRYAEILVANNARPPMWLRVNRARISVADYRLKLSEAGIEHALEVTAPEALRLARPVDVKGLPGFDAGEVSVQDAAAQHAAHLLGARAGERVLDLCAAPGGKTCHVLELEPGIRELVAVDNSAARLQRVNENLERLRLTATVVVGDGTRPKEWWDGRLFERILLDVPCSATGVIRRHPDIKLLRRRSDIASMSGQQARLLESAWSLLAPGGRLVYASCAAFNAETSGVVRSFLETRPEARDGTSGAAAHFGVDALPGRRIPVGDAGKDGFYYACLDKSLDRPKS
jgi:16S rRNA (cytosine967-C5)-methyltransferase